MLYTMYMEHLSHYYVFYTVFRKITHPYAYILFYISVKNV